MGYTTDETTIRVDFFKPSGKWYETVSIKWVAPYFASEMDIHEGFKRSLRASIGDRLRGMTAVCLEPYHELAFPLMIDDWNNFS